MQIARRGVTRPLARIGLVMFAVVGLSIMHGFHAGAITLRAEGHDAGHHGQGWQVHGSSGLCVFVLSLVGLGLAAARLPTSYRSFPFPSTGITAVTAFTWVPPAGRLRLLDLGVLRL